MKPLCMLQGGPVLDELAQILESRSLKVETVPHLQDLEKRVRSRPASVIFLDYESPELDPIDVCRRWKLTRPLYYPSLIFVADGLDSNQIVDGLRTGANLVLTRPFHPEALVNAVMEEMHRFDGVSLPVDSSYIISEKVEYLAATNRFLDLVLYATEARSDAIEDLRLCMGELGMNAIVHGNGSDPTKKVYVNYRIDQTEVHVRIRDEGPGFHPDDLPDPTSPERLLMPTGRG